MSRVLVLGGARSGKSTFAEGLMPNEGPVDYIATAPHRPGDDEWAERVRVHRDRRPQNWTTIETHDVAGVLRTAGPTALVDCMGVWLTVVMDVAGVWEHRPGADDALSVATRDLLGAWAQCQRPVVAVSNEVGLGVVPGTASGRRFRDDLGRLNMALAASADEVWFVVAGIPQRLK